VLLVLAGVLASVFGARAVARSDAGKARLAFHLASAEIASTLKLSIQHEEDLVVSASAFVAGNPHASPADFDRWVESVHAMQRYPELQDIGLLALVPASQLSAFDARMAADPPRPFGPRSVAPAESFQVPPAGNRPYYCLAEAGLARNAASYVPADVDYCALAPILIGARDSGQPSYAPFKAQGTTMLGIETPVYRGGVAPATLRARQRAFLGWLGELLMPKIVLDRALEGHPGLAVVFRYDSGHSRLQLSSGTAPADAQSTEIALYNGWTMQSFGAAAASGVFGDRDALILLIGGVLLGVLLGVLVLVLGTGRTRALSLVHEKTRELSHLALHDSLTGLPNRALVLDRAEQMLARTARQPGTVTGALYIDIDGFKHVNDNLGHAAGDRLLRITASGCRALSASRTPSAGSAATSSSCSSRRRPTRQPPTCSPTASPRRCASPSSSATPASRSRSPRASASRSATTPRPTSCCATPTWPCTPPRPPARIATRSTTRACTATRKAAWTSKPT
jgi:hypothetical protein